MVELVWNNSVDDGKYHCKVERTAPYRGRLRLIRTADVRANEPEDATPTLLDVEVGLAYDAKFGPDVDDVADWQRRVLARIDEVEAGV